jgi:hypothetical protein
MCEVRGSRREVCKDQSTSEGEGGKSLGQQIGHLLPGRYQHPVLLISRPAVEELDDPRGELLRLYQERIVSVVGGHQVVLGRFPLPAQDLYQFFGLVGRVEPVRSKRKPERGADKMAQGVFKPLESPGDVV